MHQFENIQPQTESHETGVIDSVLGSLCLNGETERNVTVIPPAMLAAAPENSSPLYSLYMSGAHAAVQRRMHPVAQPEPSLINVQVPDENTGESLIYREIDIKEMPYLASPIVEMIR